ncbi:NUDIX hydrolase [uncultured Roseibium sp.]|uniref:NUDIX hydrolase n=1 Tax=uncultured Roseibium sp. TaxID=1936171 RepID=UPI0026204742|nr:NUDIX hydrolase [uncultured Roseibium sp.]
MSRFYPDAPRVGVSVLCFKDNKALMIKRGKEPYLGHWSLPGGLVELGETLKQAAERELREETGVQAILGEPVETFDSIVRDEHGKVVTHFILTVFRGSYLSGAALAGDDAADVAWVHIDDLDDRPTTPGTPKRIRRLMQV